MQKISGKDDFLHFFNLPQSFDGFINSYLAFEFFIGITIALLVLFILNLIYNGLISKYLFRELKNLEPVQDGESDLLKAMKMIAKSGQGPKDQLPSMGCNIKWFKN